MLGRGGKMRRIACAAPRSLLAAAPIVWATPALAQSQASEIPQTVTLSRQELQKDASTDEIFKSLFGREQFQLAPAPYPVILDEMNVGDIIVTPGADPLSARVSGDDILRIIQPLLNDTRARELATQLSGRAAITAAELTEAGIAAYFDTTQLALVIDVPLADRTVVPIGLRRRYDPSANAQLLRQADVSAVINGFASANYVHASNHGETGLQSLNLNTDIALNVHGLVFESGLSYSDRDDPNFRRTDTRLTYDLVKDRVRIEAGDLRGRTRGLQGSAELAGIAAYRKFEINPYEEYRSNPSQSFELERPARVSIYINGQLIRDIRLRPGRYNLTDLPLREAAGNDVVLEILYDTGEVERAVFSAFYDFDLLKSGLSDFGVNAGPRARYTSRGREYDTDNLTFSGYYRYGFNDHLTLGVNAQGDKDLYNIGAEGLLATGVGSFGMFASYSETELVSGGAQTLFYRYNGDNPKSDLTFDMRATRFDKGYLTLSASPNRYSDQYSTRLAFAVSEATRLQMTAGYSKLHDAKPDEQSYAIALSHNFGHASLSANVRYDQYDNKEEISAGISLTFRFGSGSGQVSYDSFEPTFRAALSQSPSMTADSFGYDVAYTDQPDADELVAGATYVGNRFESRIEQRVGRVSRDDAFGDENQTSLFLGSAIVHADGHTALSRPVFDSFAIFRSGKGAEDFDFSVDPQESFESDELKYAAKSSVLGPAVLNDLQSYFVRNVSIDAPNAPAGVSVGGKSVSIQPGYRSGYVVDVGNARNVAVISRLVDASGRAIAYAAAYAILEDGTETPIFTNASGRFYVEGLLPGETVRIRLDASPKRITSFEVPDTALGILRLEQPVVLDQSGDLPIVTASIRGSAE